MTKNLFREPVPTEPMIVEVVLDERAPGFLRDVADGVERWLAKENKAADGRNRGYALELPFGMPTRLDYNYLQQLEQFLDEAGHLDDDDRITNPRWARRVSFSGFGRS